MHARGRVTIRVDDSTLVVCLCSLTDLKNIAPGERVCLPECMENRIIHEGR